MGYVSLNLLTVKQWLMKIIVKFAKRTLQKSRIIVLPKFNSVPLIAPKTHLSAMYVKLDIPLIRQVVFAELIIVLLLMMKTPMNVNLVTKDIEWKIRTSFSVKRSQLKKIVEKATQNTKVRLMITLVNNVRLTINWIPPVWNFCPMRR